LLLALNFFVACDEKTEFGSSQGRMADLRFWRKKGGTFVSHNLRLINRKGAIQDLAKKKTPTGQTALETELVFSKLDFKF
jgi:hypothetical protein